MLLSCSLLLQLFSQKKPSTNEFWKNIRYTSRFGLNFGNGFFSGTLTPGAVYPFNKSFGLGMRASTPYNSISNVYRSAIFGVSVISIFNPINIVQVSSEFEYASVNQNYENPIVQDRNYWVPALFLGLGYHTNTIVFGVHYDVLYDRNKSIYADRLSPFLTVFF